MPSNTGQNKENSKQKERASGTGQFNKVQRPLHEKNWQLALLGIASEDGDLYPPVEEIHLF
jgi:hypothetical protein